MLLLFLLAIFWILPIYAFIIVPLIWKRRIVVHRIKMILRDRITHKDRGYNNKGVEINNDRHYLKVDPLEPYPSFMKDTKQGVELGFFSMEYFNKYKIGEEFYIEIHEVQYLNKYKPNSQYQYHRHFVELEIDTSQPNVRVVKTNKILMLTVFILLGAGTAWAIYEDRYVNPMKRQLSHSINNFNLIYQIKDDSELVSCRKRDYEYVYVGSGKYAKNVKTGNIILKQCDNGQNYNLSPTKYELNNQCYDSCKIPLKCEEGCQSNISAEDLQNKLNCMDRCLKLDTKNKKNNIVLEYIKFKEG